MIKGIAIAVAAASFAVGSVASASEDGPERADAAFDRRIDAVTRTITPDLPRARLLAIAAQMDALSKQRLQASRPGQAGRALNTAATAAYVANDRQLARRYLERARPLCEMAKLWRCVGSVISNLAVVELDLHNPVAAARLFREGSEVLTQYDDPTLAMDLRLNAANLRSTLGDVEGALADARAVEREFANHPRISFTHAIVAQAQFLLELGRYPEAEKEARRAIAIVKSGKNVGFWPIDVNFVTGALLARARAHQGDRSTLNFFEAFEARKSKKLAPQDEFEFASQYADALVAVGEARRAAPYMQRALTLVLEEDRPKVLVLAASSRAGVGDWFGAYEFERRAREEIVKRSGATFTSAVTDSALQVKLAQREAASARADAKSAREIGRLRLTVALIALLGFLGAAALFFRLKYVAIRTRIQTTYAERTRVARELHDTLLQSLAGIAYRIEGVASAVPPAQSATAVALRQVASEAQKSLVEAREAVSELRISDTDRGDFRARLADAVHQGDLPPCKLHVEGDWAHVNEEVIRQLLRIAHEAVVNARRHASATRITVTALAKTTSFNMRIEDDGVGFVSTQREVGAGGGWGVVGMKERAQLIGGRLTIDSKPGAGTSVALTVPVFASVGQRMTAFFRSVMKRARLTGSDSSAPTGTFGAGKHEPAV